MSTPDCQRVEAHLERKQKRCMRDMQDQEVSLEGLPYEEGQYVEPGEAPRQVVMRYFANMGSKEEALAAIEQLFRDMVTPGTHLGDGEVSAAEGGERSQDQSPLQAGAFENKDLPESSGDVGKPAGSGRTSS